MKKSTLKVVLGAVLILFCIHSFAQCPAINCPTDITVNNSVGNCGAAVTYTPPIGMDPCATGSQTFNYTGGLQTWTVPSGVTSITVDLYGAQGGGSLGGNGGRSQATIAVTPGQILNIHVGGNPTAQLGPGGYNGGGATTVLPCGPNSTNSFPGGGASDIRVGGNTLSDRIIVAGGGGGQGWSSGLGGPGGGSLGGDGAPSWIAGTHGKGGTQIAGGIGGFYSGNGQSSPSGIFGIGGDSGPVNTYCTGGAGGGGWYGGGAGYVSAGGGGSSYVGGAGVTAGVTTSGVQSGNGQVIISYSGPTITTTQTAGLASGSTFPVGVTTNTFSATSGFGTVTCSFTVTVVDAEAPTLTCPGAITINTDAGQCTSTAAIGTATGTDNCGTPSITNNAPASFPIGNTTVTWTSTDGAFNTTTCTQQVTVIDAEAPTVTCPANVASCDPLVNGIAPASSDNCTGATVAYTLTGATTGSGVNDASGTTFNTGVTTVSYTVTDASNNQESCSFTITISPLPTVVIAPFNPDTVCVNYAAFALPVGTPATGTYSGNGVNSSTFDPGAAGVGTHYVVYTYTDANACTNMDSTAIVVASCAGIEEVNGLSGVTVFPNPTNDVIHVSLGNLTTAVNCTLTSIDGKVVYQVSNVIDENIAIDISNNANGVYLLKVETTDTEQLFRVIKQ